MTSKGYDSRRDPNLAELDPVDLAMRESIERFLLRLRSLDGVKIAK